MEELPIYSVTFNPDDATQGVYAISLVDEPAIGVDFVALSKQEPIKFQLKDAEKRLVTGPVLIPDQKIYRNQNGKEFYITFNAETIEKLSQEFLKRDYHKNSFYNHDEAEKLSLSMVESWITGHNDKSKDLGYDLPKGTWMATMKLSEGDWEEYVKSGKVKAFSIDGMLNFREVKMSKIQKLFKQFIQLFKDVNSISVEGVDMYYEGTLSEGTILSDSEGNPIEASFEMDGFRYTTDMSGRIQQIEDLTEINNQEEKPNMEEILKEIVAVLEGAGMDVSKIKSMMPEAEAPEMEVDIEAEKAPEMEEEMAKEEMAEMPKEEEMKEEMKEDEEKVAMKAQLDALTEKIQALEEENIKLKKAPAATKLSVVPQEGKQVKSKMDAIRGVLNVK